MAENEQAKVDETTDVSIEELKAQIERLQSDNEKLKKANTNASADASKWKKELQSRMSEQERKDAEEAEEKQKLLARLEELETNSRNDKGRAEFIGFGLNEIAAKDATDAFYKGDLSGFMKVMKTYIADHDKAIKAEGIRNTVPPASGGTGVKQYTKEDFDKLSYRELNDLFVKDREQYDRLKNA